MAKKRTKTESTIENDDSDEEESPKRSRLAENKENESANVSTRQVPQNPVNSIRSLEKKLEANLRSGKIKRIVLQNFMCHANFEVNLNKCINVIVGLNGSGKSAILTAIAIGLGGKASSTSRSTSLKEFVRHGENSATIEITLSNDGLDAYEPNVFGDEIIVVRTINANSGSSSYRLKTQDGKTITTSKQDLTKMSLCLNIQVENPVLILNQDAARSFLKECDPKKLYQFFMKATQIEAITNKLSSCHQIAVNSKNKLEHLEQTLQEFENEIKVLKAKLSRLQSVLKLKLSIDSLQNEIAWLNVTEVEGEIQLLNQKLTVKRDEIRKMLDIVSNKKKYEKEIKEKIRELGTAFELLNQDFEVNNTKYEESRKFFETERHKLSEYENANQNFINRIKNKIDPNIRQLEEGIMEHENNPMNVENLRLENTSQIAEVEKKLQTNAGTLSNVKRDYHQYLQTLHETRENIEEICKQENAQKHRITQINAQIQQYKGAGKNTLSVYGASAERLLKELDVLYKAKKFTQLPRAFLGRFIEVPNKKYRQAVETILRNSLTSFIVNCHKDRLLLDDVLKKYQDIRKPQIYTTEFSHQVYNVGNGMVRLDPKIGVILFNIIKVNDPVVMNCLIDQSHIEKIALVDSIDNAIQLTEHERNVPVNLLKVVQLQPLSEFYPAPHYRTYSIRSQPMQYIQTNFKEIIDESEKERAIVEHKCTAIRDRVNHVQIEIRKFEKLSNEKKELMVKIQREEQKLSTELKELRAVEFPENTDAEFLIRQLEEEKDSRIRCQKKVEETAAKVNEQKVVVENYQRLLDEQTNLKTQSCDKMRQTQQKIETNQKSLSKIAKCDSETKARELQVEEMEIDQNIKQLEVRKQLMTSNIVGERVCSFRTEEDLMASIQQAKRQINQIESRNENIEQVEQQLKIQQELYDKTKGVFTGFEKVLKKLNAARDNRYMFVRKLRQHMSIRMRHKFFQLMELHNYSADMEIDHKNKKLMLQIIPRDTEVDNAVSTTKALSGGERSYSTVAFLLALWSCVDHPFYFLDEYDVFSDEYNRHIMTTLLINEAENKKDKQFGYLTPQELSGVTASDTISIHKLLDPGRRD